MPETPQDARLDVIPTEQIAALAVLYDRFAHALDPFDQRTDEAEAIFQQEVAEHCNDLCRLLGFNPHPFQGLRLAEILTATIAEILLNPPVSIVEITTSFGGTITTVMRFTGNRKILSRGG